MQIVEAKPKHFDSLYPLFQKLDRGRFGRNEWKGLLEVCFNSADGITGFVLLDDRDDAVGFIGTLFSERTVNGEKVSFCNTHSWIVSEEHRSKGLFLLHRVNQFKEHVLTNFSASDVPSALMKKFGWVEVPFVYHSYFPFYRPVRILKQWKRSFRVKRLTAIEPGMEEESAAIFQYHKPYRCIHLIVEDPDCGRSAYMVLKELNYFPKALHFLRNLVSFRFKIGQVHYISDKEFLHSEMAEKIRNICSAMKWFGILMPTQWIGENNQKYWKPFDRYKKRSVLVKSNGLPASHTDIDMLFSEIFVMNL